MKIEGWLKMNPASGRAELNIDGEVFSFPARLASHRLTLTTPETVHRRLPDPLTAAGASATALRGTARLARGRAELTLASGEVVSLPARFAGQLLAVDVLDLVAGVGTPAAAPAPAVVHASRRAEEQIAFFRQISGGGGGGGGDREALSIVPTEADLDIL